VLNSLRIGRLKIPELGLLRWRRSFGRRPLTLFAEQKRRKCPMQVTAGKASMFGPSAGSPSGLSDGFFYLQQGSLGVAAPFGQSL